MLDSADLVLLAAVAVVLLGSQIRSGVVLRRDMVKTQKYPLFKVRDDLVYLVATGKLNEDDFVFQELYKAVNHYIAASNNINLKYWVKTVERARRRGIDPAVQGKVERIHQEIVNKDPAVMQVVMGFYWAMIGILIQNSLLLRILSRYAAARKIIERCFAWWRRRSTQRRAYVIYREYARAACAL